MGKKILSLIALITCSILALSSCGSTSITMDKSGSVTSNGGNVVSTNDYVYFINGVETYSTTYKTGEVTKASLMRTKKSNMAKLADATASDYETVVSKLIVSSDYNAGYYIYGDYVYYAVPSTNKDKTGTVKSEVLNFFKTKLDGTSTSKNLSTEDYPHDAQFRYVESGENVYLVVYSTTLAIYDTATGKQVYLCEDAISQVMFDEDNASNVLYYTMNPINDSLYDPESDSATASKYHDIRKVTIDNEPTDEVVLRGAGEFTVGADKDSQIGFTGATFNLLNHKDGVLYFSYTSLDTTVAGTTYVGVTDAELVNDTKVSLTNVQKAENVMNYGDANAAAIFAGTSLYIAKNQIVYLDATLGLVQYNYEQRNNTATSNGNTRVYYSEEITTSTISSYVDGKLYYYSAEGIYYQLNLAAILGGAEANQLQVNGLAINTTWYQPEVVAVGGTEYFVASYTDSSYYAYAYAIDLTALQASVTEAKTADDAEAKEEDKTHLSDLYVTDTTSEYIMSIVDTMLGYMSETDQESYDKVMEELIEAEEDAE